MGLLDISYKNINEEFVGYNELINRINEIGESYKKVEVDKICVILEDILMTGSWYDKDCWCDRIREVLFYLDMSKDNTLSKIIYEVFYYILFEFRRQLKLEFNLNSDIQLCSINKFLKEIL